MDQFWNDFLKLIETAALADVGPDVEAVLSQVNTDGLQALITPAGQAQVLKAVAAITADSMKAGNDITKLTAGVLLTYVQQWIAAQQSPQKGA